MESLEAQIARLEAENAILKADIAGYVERNAKDSEAFGRIRVHLANAAKTAQAVVDLHAEHVKSGV